MNYLYKKIHHKFRYNWIGNKYLQTEKSSLTMNSAITSPLTKEFSTVLREQF